MLFRTAFNFFGVSLLFVTPIAAQFGIAGNRKNNAASGSFQELNEQAKQMQAGGGAGGLGDLSKLLGEMDPKMLEQLGEMGTQFDEALKAMAEMSPDELEKQMKDALQLLQSGDMMQNIMQHQDEILKTLEETGQVDQAELARFKTDPEYFEQKMKESFEQMSSLFNDPEVLNLATKSMAGLTGLYSNPGQMEEMMQELLAEFNDDEKIEQVRRMFLESPEAADPALMEMLGGAEMQALLKDPKKWREAIKEGSGLLQKGGAGMGGAGIGEL